MAPKQAPICSAFAHRGRRRALSTAAPNAVSFSLNHLLKILRAHDRAFYLGVHLHSNLYRRSASRRASQHPLHRRELVYETVAFIQMAGLLCLGRSDILSLRVPSTELLPAESVLSTIFMLYLLTPVHQRAEHPVQLTKAERQALFARCFSRIRDTDLANGWFYFADLHTVRRENVVDWILWALYSSSRADMVEEWEDEIEGYIRTIEKLLGRELEQGWNPDVKCLKVTLDPVTALHRPLVWYFVSTQGHYLCVIQQLTTQGRGIGRLVHVCIPSNAWLQALYPA